MKSLTMASLQVAVSSCSVPILAEKSFITTATGKIGSEGKFLEIYEEF
jgi:hypothetical protein